MTELPLTGGCNCGAVRYKVTRPAEGSFRIVAGAEKLRMWEPIPDDGLPRFPESRHAATS